MPPPHAQIGKGRTYLSYVSIKRDLIETGREPATSERTHEAIFADTPDEFVAWVKKQVRVTCQVEANFFIPKLTAALSAAKRDETGCGSIPAIHFQAPPRERHACLHSASQQHFSYFCPYKSDHRHRHESARKAERISTPLAWGENDKETPLWTETESPLWYDLSRKPPVTDLLVETTACRPEPGTRPTDRTTWAMDKAFSWHVRASTALEETVAFMNLGFCPSAQELVRLHRAFNSVRDFRTMIADPDFVLPYESLQRFRDHFRRAVPQLFKHRSYHSQLEYEKRGTQQKYEFPPNGAEHLLRASAIERTTRREKMKSKNQIRVGSNSSVARVPLDCYSNIPAVLYYSELDHCLHRNFLPK